MFVDIITIAIGVLLGAAFITAIGFLTAMFYDVQSLNRDVTNQRFDIYKANCDIRKLRQELNALKTPDSAGQPDTGE